MSRHVDSKLLAELRPVWRAHGCAVCGETGPLELHHLTKRSHGGPDSPGNIVGLCGAFSKHRCHARVEDGSLRLQTDVHGALMWVDTRSGETGPVSRPWGALERGLADDAAGRVDTFMSDSSYLSSLSAPAIPETPEARYAYLQSLSKHSVVTALHMGATLLKVKESGEWSALGFDSFRDYYGETGLGLPQGSVSKMLIVAEVYRDVWARAVESGASVEKLYHAQRLIGSGLADEPVEDAEAAVCVAEAYPAHELVKAARGVEESRGDSEATLCPTCGQKMKPNGS